MPRSIDAELVGSAPQVGSLSAFATPFYMAHRALGGRPAVATRALKTPVGKDRTVRQPRQPFRLTISAIHTGT